MVVEVANLFQVMQCNACPKASLKNWSRVQQVLVTQVVLEPQLALQVSTKVVQEVKVPVDP